MATVEDQLLALTATVNEIAAAVKNPVAPTVDFTPVLDAIAPIVPAIAGVQTTANAILAQDEPTPAPAPVPAPAADAAPATAADAAPTA